jgi:hypothetical protein
MGKGEIKVIIIVIFIILLFAGSLFLKISIDSKETRYCGKVVKVYMTGAGYKVHSEKRVVFYSDSLKRNIDVRVNFQTFSNTKIDEYVCFYLNERQLNE